MDAKRKIILCAPIIAFLLVMSAGCVLNEPTAPEKVRFGVLLPMSGSLENIGDDCSKGIILATEEINAAGGISSLNGALLEPVFGDTKGEPETGEEITLKLINEDKVNAIIGAYQSSVTMSCTKVAEKMQTPFIVEMGVADIITERGFEYLFRICPKAQYYGREQVEFLSDLKEKTGYEVKNVALLYENTGFGTSIAMAQKENLKKYDLEVIYELSYNAENITELDDLVIKVFEVEPDAILTVTYPDDSVLIRQIQVENGKTGIPFLDSAGGTVSHEYMETLGSNADGTLSLCEFSCYTEQGKELKKRFNARFGVNLTAESAYAYQAVLVLKDALERAGSTDKEKLREALSQTNLSKGPQMVLPAERLSFDKDGQNEFAPICIIQIQNGKYVPVWPDEFAQSKAVL